MASKKETSEAAKKTVTKKQQADPGTEKQTAVKMEVLGVDGKVQGSVSLSRQMFGSKINPQLMAQAVRVYLANQRQGNASTKTRGEVSGSTRKIYRQKGTGRARHGGMRAPLFVHGGVAHGPRPHDFSLSMPQKMKQAALFSALSSKVKDGEMRVIAGLETLEPKTKQFSAVMKALQLNTKQHPVLLVTPEKPGSVIRGVRNLPGVTYLGAQQLNTYQVLNNHIIVFMQDAIKTLEKTFARKDVTK